MPFLTLALALANHAMQDNYPIAPGPFQPTMDSLKQYTAPKWFRDAKFGIWAHWGPQAVPMDGDWYARNLYNQGSEQYNDHLERYGHPSVAGYKDIIPLWKAEKWDPDRLMKLYKEAGAHYFVSMGSHHDNFFLWNSKLHRWNSVQMGPHRDVVGEWQQAAKKYGLPFGVSEHLGASFTWFQMAHGADKTGPKAGVPYDGADPKYWDLYHFPAKPGDTGWYSNDPRWWKEWYADIRELVDNYHPDLLYSDGGVPFGNEVGLSMIAHFYNANAAVHHGQVEAVYNCKQVSDGRWVQDLERGVMGGIDPNPWQTDTSIGDWFYNRNWKFRPVSWVVHTLVDNVSKNGNLLLNVVLRPDGSLDPEVETMLHDLAVWSRTHGEAIYGSRPWTVYGEGSVKARGGAFKEDYTYTAKDIRFTTQGKTLYALAMGWPSDGKVTIRSLARPTGESVNKIKSIRLLGYKDPIKWVQTPDALTVYLPTKPVSELTAGLRIEGSSLTAIPIPEEVTIVHPDSDGNITLPAEAASLHGSKITVEDRFGAPNIGYWDEAGDWASWTVEAPAAKYELSIDYASPFESSKLDVRVGLQEIILDLANTGGFDKFTSLALPGGTFDVSGRTEVSIHPLRGTAWHAVNVRALRLRKVGIPSGSATTTR